MSATVSIFTAISRVETGTELAATTHEYP